MIIVAAIDATVTVLFSVICIRYWGLVGAAGATVLAATAAATVSFSIGFVKFGLTLPIGHLLRIAAATIAMAAVLDRMPEARSFVVLAIHIATGAAIYIAFLALLYARTLTRLLRSRATKP
jgi:hypothetical protein